MKSPVHLNAMRAFEASARHKSFSAAAQELNVTPAAVGQLVRGLEGWLGKPLFRRKAAGHERLETTEIADQALPHIRAGLDKLALGLATLQEGSNHGVLTLTVSPAFAAKWLLQRIDRFQSAWPDIDLRLDTSRKPLDFHAHDIDVGVRYGPGVWPKLKAEKLMGEQIYPVCSPRFRNDHRELLAPADLAHQTLIHDLSIDTRAGFASWEAWLQSAGASDVSTSRGMRINNSAAVLQAAIDGHGIALARSVMANDDLAAGRLVRLFPQIDFESRLAYFLVYRPESSNVPKVLAFREWMLREIRGGDLC